MAKKRYVAVPTDHFLRAMDPGVTENHLKDHIEVSRSVETRRTKELAAVGVLKRHGPAAMKIHKK